MVDISVGERDLHIYSGNFVPSSPSNLPSGFRVMRNSRRARRRGGSRASNQYLPVVVLNSQQPLPNNNKNINNGLAQSRMDNYNYNQQQQQQQQGAVTRGAERWPGAFELPDLTFGLFGSRSSDFVADSKSSGSDMYGSHQFGGSGCGGSGGLRKL